MRLSSFLFVLDGLRSAFLLLTDSSRRYRFVTWWFFGRCRFLCVGEWNYDDRRSFGVRYVGSMMREPKPTGEETRWPVEPQVSAVDGRKLELNWRESDSYGFLFFSIIGATTVSAVTIAHW